MKREAIHIQSQEAREKINDIFCRLIAFSAFFSVLLYSVLQLFYLVAACSGIALLFTFFVYLNKKKQYAISREGIIIVTNLGVVFFSLFIGFDSGIYLYLFAAPLIIYVLVDFRELKRILAYLIFYLSSLIAIFLFKEYDIQLLRSVPKDFLNYIYFFNFTSAFVINFSLIFYFAYNNNRFIESLQENKTLLSQEIALRTESEDLLKKSIKEREVLLSEIHHRVKNNLSIISAFINMQREGLEDPRVKEIFDVTQDRIYTIALIHNMLYQNGSLSKIDFKEYAESFCQHIQNTLFQREGIEIKRKIQAVVLSIDSAIPLALIMNELISNAYKHAFSTLEEGTIAIGLEKNGDDSIHFWVKDNGVGAKEEILNAESGGMSIVISLVEQLDAELQYTKEQGSLFSVLIPSCQ